MKIEKIQILETYQNELGKAGFKKEEIIKEFFIGDDLKLVVFAISRFYENGYTSQEWFFQIYSKHEVLDLWMFNTLFAEWTKAEMLKTLGQFEKYGLSMNI
ncbi:MAG: hypothetical protein IKT40_08290 [Bacilli bacterium]|nr:hypothetical protein [Bacilli bacterium]